MCWMTLLFLVFIYFVEIGLSFFEHICDWLLQQIWIIIKPYTDRCHLIQLLHERSLKLLLIPLLALLSLFYICIYFVQMIIFYLKKPVPSQISQEINFETLLHKSKFWMYHSNKLNFNTIFCVKIGRVMRGIKYWLTAPQTNWKLQDISFFCIPIKIYFIG